MRPEASQSKNRQELEEAKRAAVEVLLHNANGPFRGLPRTAGWGYPEPYTRDLMLSTFGVLASGNRALIESHRRVLETAARNQSARGHIPSLVHDQNDRGYQERQFFQFDRSVKFISVNFRATLTPVSNLALKSG